MIKENRFEEYFFIRNNDNGHSTVFNRKKNTGTNNLKYLKKRYPPIIHAIRFKSNFIYESIFVAGKNREIPTTARNKKR